MSLHIPCPNCGADVVFRSPALPDRVCDACRTMLVRSDGAVTAIGKAGVLPFDISPVRIGMRGRFDDTAFEVIGRVRWAWTDGAWNEWLLLYEGGSHAWLGEAMGQYMLLWERPFSGVRTQVMREIAKGQPAIVGTDLQLDNEKMTISDEREVMCIAAEGELPFSPRPGWRLYSVDMRGMRGDCATLQRDKSETTFYQGRYVTLEQLSPHGLREIEGWELPAYAV